MSLRDDFDGERFLREHWQRKPLVIRNAWREWRNPLAPDELAGLACDVAVESRLVLRTRGRRRVEHGPLAAARFGKLPAKDWTLLVQAVDQRVPAVAALLEAFRFLPSWRVDDVMVSYAVDRGGVGPHFDQYDVFLIQGLGRRRWQVGARCDHDTALLPHDDLRLLAEFVPLQEWVLDPGDILYLPPRYAHDGGAVGADCMTYSIGFRAPSRSDLIGYWCDHVVTSLCDDDRYADPGAKPAANPGEISPAALAELRRLTLAPLRDEAAFRHWFGCHSTVRKYPDDDQRPARAVSVPQLQRRLARGATLVRHPASRYAFIRDEGGLTLFVDGEAHACTGASARWAERLCARRDFVTGDRQLRARAALALAVALVNQGSLIFGDDA